MRNTSYPDAFERIIGGNFLYVHDLEQTCQAYQQLADTCEESHQIVVKVAERIVPMQPAVVEWFKTALSSEQKLFEPGKRSFAISVLEASWQAPSDLAEFCFRMAVEEPDPSYNRYFLWPAICHFGAYETCQRLLKLIRDGFGLEKAGALNALYWAGSSFFDNRRGYFFLPSKDEDHSHRSRLRKQIARQRTELCLTEFLTTNDLDMERAFIRWISIEEADYSPERQPDLKRAITKALRHPDEFVRSIMESHFQASPLLPSLPPRGAR